MMSSSKSKEIAAVAAVLLLFSAGCHAHRGGAIPRIDAVTISVPRLTRVIAYELRVESEVGDDFKLRKLAQRQLEAALYTAGAAMKESGLVAEPDAELKLNLLVKGSTVAQIFSGFVSGLTMTLLPAVTNLDIILDATVTSESGGTRQYRYRDSFRVWIQLFLIVAINPPDQVLEDLLADMMRSLARDMQRDGWLPSPAAAGPPAAAGEREPTRLRRREPIRKRDWCAAEPQRVALP